MAIKVVHELEFESIFETDGNSQKALKLDNSGNVQFSKSVTGLKGEVTLPEIPEVPVAINGASIQDRTITFTKTDGSQAVTVELPALPVDVKLANAQLVEGTKLRLTLSDDAATTFDVELSSLIPEMKTAQQYWTEIKALSTFKADLLALLKGEEVQDIAGNTKGFLLPEA